MANGLTGKKTSTYFKVAHL